MSLGIATGASVTSKPLESVTSGAFGSYMIPAGKVARIIMSGAISEFVISASTTGNSGESFANKSGRTGANIAFGLVGLQTVSISTQNLSITASRGAFIGGGTQTFNKSVYSRILIDGVSSNILEYGFHEVSATSQNSSGWSTSITSTATVETYFTAEIYPA